MSTVSAIQETATPWEKLAATEEELKREIKSQDALLEELATLADAVERAKKQADATNPRKWSPERAKYFEAFTLLEAKQAEVSRQIEKCQAITQRREELLREITKAENEIGKAEREFTIARNDFEEVQNAMRNAREVRALQRIADLEPTLEQRRKTLDATREAVESAWRLRGDSVPKQWAPNGALVPSPINRLRALSAEFKKIDDAVGQHELRKGRRLDRIEEIKREKQAVDQKLNRWDSGTRVDEHGQPIDRSGNPFLNRRANNLDVELAKEKSEFKEECRELEAETKQRDEMFADFVAPEKRAKTN